MKTFSEWISFRETLALKGDYKGTIFQRLVAAEYVLLPPVEQEAWQGYQDLWKKISRQNDFLKSKFNFEPTTDDPYKSMKHLTGEIDKQKQAGIKKPTMRVFDEPPEGGHPTLSNDQNTVLRGVHDAIAHLFGQHPFSARGEYGAYNRHLKTLCNVDQAKAGECPAAEVLFTEIIGQTSYFYVYGDYTVQKAAIMHDFDHWHIGALAPDSSLNEFFVLQNKELIPREGFSWRAFSQAKPQLAVEMNRQIQAGGSRSPLMPLPGEPQQNQAAIA
jgi:hypothetical protein